MDRESGLTLVELVIAMVIFAIIASAVVAGLAATMKTARLDKNRLAASQLAARELEITRNEFKATLAGPSTLAANNYVENPHALPGQTAGQPLEVDGVPYTVTRNVEWLPAGSGKSACDGGAAITYPTMAVNVAVTWPSMGNVQPVTSNTVLTPPKGVLSSNLSFVGVKVVNASGLPSSGRLVTLNGPGGSQTDATAADGCAVFAVSNAGSFTASMSEAGFVDYYGDASPSKSVVVTAGSLSQVTINYDEAATLRVTYTTDPGYALPQSWPRLTLANPGLQPFGTTVVPTGSATTTIASLWPFADGYGVWAGSCQQSDPAAAGGTRDPNTLIAPGGAATTTTRLAPVGVTVETAAALPVAGATVTATPAVSTGCGATEDPVTLGTTDASGRLDTSLPAGEWTLEVAGRSPQGSWPTTPTLLPSSGPTNVLVVTQ